MSARQHLQKDELLISHKLPSASVTAKWELYVCTAYVLFEDLRYQVSVLAVTKLRWNKVIT